jgi:hypothetical protein
MHARRLKRDPAEHGSEWLQTTPGGGEGVSVEAWLHDGRYLEIGVYDYDAAKDRAWTITMIDRETAARATIGGPKKYAARDEAMRQVGCPVPVKASAAA